MSKLARYSPGNLIKRASVSVRGAACTRFYIDGDSVKPTILLAGTGRSGTSWLADIINFRNDFRYIFEPFCAREVSQVSELRPMQYLRPGNCDVKYMNIIGDVIGGRIRNSWADRFNDKLIIRKRLIKVIRANLFLKWINVNFPDIRIVFLMRHPLAVARSKLKWNWGAANRFLEHAELIEDYLSSFKSEIESCGTTFERILFEWCVDNYVPLKQFKEGEMHIVFYEHLCVRPQEEVERLFGYLGIEYDHRVNDTISRPSKLCRQDSAVKTGRSLIDTFEDYFTAEQIDRSVEILSMFGLDKIYGKRPVPHIDGNVYPLCQ